MSRYIDADALLADLDIFAEDKQWRKKRTLRERWLRRCGIDIFRLGIKAFPTADVIPADPLRDIASGVICGACDPIPFGQGDVCVKCLRHHIGKLIGKEKSDEM